MKYRFVWALIPGAALVLARCVGGDDSSTADGGKDATQNDVVGNDVAQNDASTDAPVDVPVPPPTPDGSLVWLNHYNNNVYLFDPAFSDLGVNENGGLTYVVAGKFATDPSNGNTFHFGTLNLGPATGSDFFSGGVDSTGSSVWGKSAISNGTADRYEALTVDAQGNVYVFGVTDATSVTVKNVLTGPTSFVAKLSASGTPLWDHVYRQNGNGPLYGPKAMALAGGNLVVAMTFQASITYDTGTTFTPDAGGGDQNIFVAALDPATGSTKWTGEYGSPNNDTVSAMAATPQGDVIVAGTLDGTMTGLSGAGMPVIQLGDAGTGVDGYLLKIDATGKATYNVVYGEMSSSVFFNGVAYHNGTIAVAAQFNGNVDFGKGAVNSNGTTDGVVFTVDETTKNTNFVTPLQGSASDVFTTVAFDAWGELVAAGYYGYTNASATLGTQALPQTSVDVAGMVLAKWDTTGTILWKHGFVPTLDGGAPPYNASDASDIQWRITPTRVQTTTSGQIVVTGSMSGGADFGKGYQGQLSTLGYTHCTCGKFCNSQCIIVNPPACCNTLTAGYSADGFVGVWQP